MGIILAPYVEKGNGKGVDCATFSDPSSRAIPSARSEWIAGARLGVKDIEVADYHYQFTTRWPESWRSAGRRRCRSGFSAPSAKS
jgi:hypothetical protein